MINIIKRLVLPVKVLCGFILSSIFSILIYLTLFIPLVFFENFPPVCIVLYVIAPIAAMAIGYYTTFRWLFYDENYKKWKLK